MFLITSDSLTDVIVSTQYLKIGSLPPTRTVKFPFKRQDVSLVPRILTAASVGKGRALLLVLKGAEDYEIYIEPSMQCVYMKVLTMPQILEVLTMPQNTECVLMIVHLILLKIRVETFLE